MKVLFQDDKYTDENIPILQQYIREYNLSGNAQVCLLNSKKYLKFRKLPLSFYHKCRCWRSVDMQEYRMVGELTPLKQLQWVHDGCMRFQVGI